MKTAVSIPDEVFKEVERLAKRMKISRSRLYSLALREYLARHIQDQVTEAMNKALADIGAQSDPFLDQAAKEVLERNEW